MLFGGEGGIRTPDRLAPMPHFECGAFNRSATSPARRPHRPIPPQRKWTNGCGRIAAQRARVCSARRRVSSTHGAALLCCKASRQATSPGRVAARLLFLNQEVLGDCANAGDAGEGHGCAHFHFHQLQHMCDACLAAARQRIGPGAPEQNGPGAQSQHA